MNIQGVGVLKRCAAGLLLAAGLGGCAVYGPPYGGDPYYGNGGYSGYSGYAGPPVELNLGLGYYGGNRHGHYRRDGWRDGGRHHHDRRDHRRGRN